MKKSLSSAFIVIAALASLVGCPKEQSQATIVDAGAAVDASIPSAPSLAHMLPGESKISKLDANAVILRVDGTDITKLRLDQAVIQQGMSGGIPPAMLDGASKVAFEKPAYEKLIERQLLVNEAKKRGLLPTLQEAEAATKPQHDALIAKLPPGKTFADLLKEMGTDEAGFNAELPNDVAIQRLLQSVEKSVPEPKEEQLKKFFEDNRSRMVLPETASISHILIGVAQGATEAEEKAALDKATAIAAAAKGKNKAAFQKMADEKSEDPTVKKNHGDLGMFAKGDMLPELEEAAFKLKEGEVSAPVRSPAGYHVLFGQGTKPARMREYAEVKPLLAQREKQKMIMDKMDELLNDLRAKAKIERVVEPAASPFDGAGKGPMPMPPSAGAPAPSAPAPAAPAPSAPAPAAPAQPG